VFLSRYVVIQQLFELQADAEFFGDDIREDYRKFSDDQLVSAYCLTGLFRDNHPDAVEEDILGLQ